MKAWYQSKTLWLAVGTALTPALGDLVGLLETSEGVPSWLVTLLGAGFVVLRFMTDKAVTRPALSDTVSGLLKRKTGSPAASDQDSIESNGAPE